LGAKKILQGQLTGGWMPTNHRVTKKLTPRIVGRKPEGGSICRGNKSLPGGKSCEKDFEGAGGNEEGKHGNW